MHGFKSLAEIFNKNLDSFKLPESPSLLYDPVKYVLSIGGKRIRPLLLLAAYNLYKEDVDFAFEGALAIEFFHNFSLLHDDIMDNADVRRGQKATHIKYDVNAAILSGDVMLIYTYKFLEKYKEQTNAIYQLMTKTSIEVCEGQRFDMDYEKDVKVEIQDYVNMIRLKTSVLLGCAMQMGGLIANAPESDQKHLYEFGMNMGIAFQIQDDFLDTFGEQAKVGKKIGGDILQRKKTYLYLRSLQLLSEEQSARLRSLYKEGLEIDDTSRIEEVTALFKAAHVGVHCDELKLVYQQLAHSHLEAVEVEGDKKAILKEFADQLLNRSY